MLAQIIMESLILLFEPLLVNINLSGHYGGPGPGPMGWDKLPPGGRVRKPSPKAAAYLRQP